MLKKFDELTEEQQKLVYLMYSDKETVKNYLYNFDDKGKYIGRQFVPEIGVIHAEPINASVTVEDVKKIVKTIRKTKKK